MRSSGHDKLPGRGPIAQLVRAHPDKVRSVVRIHLGPPSFFDRGLAQLGERRLYGGGRRFDRYPPLPGRAAAGGNVIFARILVAVDGTDVVQRVEIAADLVTRYNAGSFS